MCFIACMYIDKAKEQQTLVTLKILPQDKYFSKKVLFGWFEGTALLNNCFGPYIRTIQNDNTFQGKIIPINLFKRGAGGVQTRSFTSILKGGAPYPLHPSLDTGLGKTFIINVPI